MKKGVYILFSLLVLWVVPADAVEPQLRKDDISKVMERLFSYHIEIKEYNATLVKRSFKVYIEHFDPDKSYLLESEVLPYFNLSDKEANQIVRRLNRGDYSDFIALNQLLQKAVVRAQKMRHSIAKSLIDQGTGESIPAFPTSYPKSENEIREKQRAKMVRFFWFQQSRTHLGSVERVAKVYELFEKKMQRLERNYLFLDGETKPLTAAIQEHMLTLHILKSLAKSLDTHTTYFSPEEAQEMRMSLEKQFEGVGVVLSEGIDGVVIADVIRGSPADESKRVKVNDLLVEIDGVSVEEIPFDEVLALLKKKGDRAITLGVKRAGESSLFRVKLEKRPIAISQDRIQTSYEIFGKGVIGKIVLYSFYENEGGVSSDRDIKEAITQFRKHGELYGLVLDLRENPGGYLSQSVKVAGLFISNGVVVISKYGKGEVHYLRSVAGRSFYSGPLIILTSKMSASASEIVAQTLQDYGVALVVGDERTFGKGSIQYQTVTDEKADQFFKVTVGRYYTVSGKSTQINGVAADIVVPSQYAPYNIGERYLEYPLSADEVSPAFLDPLTDLDESAKRLFRAKYLPFLQRVIPYWRRMLPTLAKNSQERLATHPDFQAFLKRQEKIRARQAGMPPNSIDDGAAPSTLKDLQMEEAVNILKDMLLLDVEHTQTTGALEGTGTE